MEPHPNPDCTPAKIRVGSGGLPDGRRPTRRHADGMVPFTAIAAAIPAALRPTIPRVPRASAPRVVDRPRRTESRAPAQRSVLDRRAAERYAEQAARDALAARAIGPRLDSAEATHLIPGARLTGDLVPAAVASLFAPR